MGLTHCLSLRSSCVVVSRSVKVQLVLVSMAILGSQSHGTSGLILWSDGSGSLKLPVTTRISLSEGEGEHKFRFREIPEPVIAVYSEKHSKYISISLRILGTLMLLDMH